MSGGESPAPTDSTTDSGSFGRWNVPTFETTLLPWVPVPPVTNDRPKQHWRSGEVTSPVELETINEAELGQFVALPNVSDLLGCRALRESWGNL